jgi:DNA-binding response OmpR family regulator
MGPELIELEIDAMATSEPMHKTALQSDDSSQKSILIVDDNADMRELLYNQLSEQYHCLQAENGQVGTELAREQLPDLVISDVMMPVMDGYQLTEKLKSDPLTSHIPIILLTAKGSMESRIKGLQLLVDDYLAKPFNIEELQLRIHNILTIRDIVRKRFGQAMDSIDTLKAGNKASQVYYSVGFASHSYFSRCFKAKFGQTPSEYQKGL